MVRNCCNILNPSTSIWLVLPPDMLTVRPWKWPIYSGN
jgi:hypothetical protein